MKHLLIICSVLFSFAASGQNLKSYSYGKCSLTGKIILKDLRHPVSGKTIKNAMVLLLPEPVKFIPNADSEEEDTAITREIRIYGDVTKNTDPDVKYKAMIGKKVIITAKYEFAPSGNYPLLVNIIEDFNYKIIE